MYRTTHQSLLKDYFKKHTLEGWGDSSGDKVLAEQAWETADPTLNQNQAGMVAICNLGVRKAETEPLGKLAN